MPSHQAYHSSNTIELRRAHDAKLRARKDARRAAGDRAARAAKGWPDSGEGDR